MSLFTVQNFFLILTTSYFSKTSEARTNCEIFIPDISFEPQHQGTAQRCSSSILKWAFCPNFFKKNNLSTNTHYPVLKANAPFLSIPAALKILMFTVTDSEWHMAGCHREKRTSDRLLTIIVQTKEKLECIYSAI